MVTPLTNFWKMIGGSSLTPLESEIWSTPHRVTCEYWSWTEWTTSNGVWHYWTACKADPDFLPPECVSLTDWQSPFPEPESRKQLTSIIVLIIKYSLFWKFNNFHSSSCKFHFAFTAMKPVKRQCDVRSFLQERYLFLLLNILLIFYS